MLTRRSALLAILIAPSGVQSMLVQEKHNQTGQPVQVLSLGTRFIVNLTDLEEADKIGGIYELEVTYKGQQKKFSAKEIWEALNQP